MEITVKNLVKKFEKKQVIDDISVKFSSGNLYCIVGRNGVGKTTLFNALFQMIDIDSGEILYDGINYKNLPPHLRQKMGFSSDSTFLINELTPFQFLHFTGRLYGLSTTEINSRVKDLLSYFFEDWAELTEKKIGILSTGTKKKVSICSAVLHLPNCLVLDEPFAGLDPISANQVLELLQDYKKPNRTIILSSHDLDYVEKLDSNIIVLEKGKIIYENTNAEIKKLGKNLDELIIKLLNTSNPKKLSWM